MVYVSNKTGTRDIWVHDLKTGAEWSLTAYHRVNYRPVLSPDEKQVAYTTSTDNHCAIFLQDLDREAVEVGLRLFQHMGLVARRREPTDLRSGRSGISAQLFKLDSGQRQPLLSRPNLSVFDASFSRDGKWIAFSAGSTLSETEVFVAPFPWGSPSRKPTGFPLRMEAGKPLGLVPDTGIILLSLHARRFPLHLGAATEQREAPVGDPYAIQHLHSVSFGMYVIRPNDFHMSATKDRLVFNLTKETANLWSPHKP